MERLTLFVVLLVLMIVVAVPALAYREGTGFNTPITDMLKQQVEPADLGGDVVGTASVPVTSSNQTVGFLWSTHTGATPNLVGSQFVGSWKGWDAYLDTFLCLDFDTYGGGLSVAPPPNTFLISPLLNVFKADRGGFGIDRDMKADEWFFNIYVTY